MSHPTPPNASKDWKALVKAIEDGGNNKTTAKKTMQSLLDEIGSNESWKLLPEGRRDVLRTSYQEVSSSGALKAAIMTMNKWITDAEVQEMAVNLLRCVSRQLSIHEEVGSKGAIEALTRAMTINTDHSGIQEHGCSAFGNLSLNEQNKQKIREFGGIEAVVAGMTKHLGVVKVQQQGCRALRNLSDHNKQNSKRIGEAGGIEAVVQGMCKHLDDKDVQEQGGHALGNLAFDDDNKERIREAGGIEAVIRGMRKHESNKYVQEEGFWVLRNLSFNNELNKQKIKDAGGMNAVERGLQLHKELAKKGEKILEILSISATSSKNPLGAFTFNGGAAPSDWTDEDESGKCDDEENESKRKTDSKAPFKRPDMPAVVNAKDSFKRFCKLLLGFGRDVLAKVLQRCYVKTSKRDWSDEAGSELAKQLDDFSMRKLGKPMMTTLKTKSIENWDITLLTFLLLSKPPGYVQKDECKAAIENLRKERNELAHSNVLQLQELEAEEFARRWKLAQTSLEILIDHFLEAEKAKMSAQITNIGNEALSDSSVANLLSSIETVQNHLAYVADQASYAKAMAEKAVTKSQVANIVRELLPQLVTIRDLENLPQKIKLSDQESFVIQARAGAGGMGAVFFALKDGTDDKYALKFCETISLAKRKDREVVILEKLLAVNHPNIVRFFGSHNFDKHLVIVMEFVQGMSLDRWLLLQDTVTLAKSRNMMLQIADGMSAVHSLNIAHRDLKPQNIMIDEVTGNVVIVDFGLSKQLNSRMTVTDVKCTIGTVMYMSPEQLKAQTSEIGLESDVWAIGVICYEIIAGFTPFEEISQDGSEKKSRRSVDTFLSKAEEAVLLNAILKRSATALPWDIAPAAFQRVIFKAMEKDKQKRQPSAREFHEELRAAFEEIDKAPDASGQGQGGGTGAKTAEQLSVQEVSAIFRACSFLEAAEAVEANAVDGKTFLALEIQELTSSIADGGLGLKPLQVRRIKKEMESLGA